MFSRNVDNEMPMTTVKNGQLKGLVGSNLDGKPFFKFLGIPYAKPPIDDLRFQVSVLLIISSLSKF